ncbi:MAG: hypothetical protein FJ285_01660 [Planctomycetes bacterium]|nr:hypothetical protein [Planctomycetota bacterium]
MAAFLQLLLGLRSLAIRIVIFVVLAGVFAWMIGGSIFPGSQVVNLPSFQWRQQAWNLQVTGNGNRAAPVRWRLLCVDARGDVVEQTLGIEGIWREVHGPVVHAGGMLIAAHAEGDGTSGWWIGSMSNDGTVGARAAASEQEARMVLRGADGANQPAAELPQGLPAGAPAAAPASASGL